MIARTSLHVVAGGGRTSVRSLLAEPPLLVRPTATDDGMLEVQLVGGAAGPLGGDDLGFEVVVDPGAQLRVRAVAASYAMPGRSGGPSTATVSARVGAGGHLDWWPAPLVSVRGSDHVIDVRLDLDEGGRVRWVDEVVLGRHGERSGRLSLRHRVTVAGHPVLHQDVSLDDGEAPAGRHGGARVVVSALVHGTASPVAAAIVDGRGRAARSPLDERTTSWVVLADQHLDALALLAELGLEP